MTDVQKVALVDMDGTVADYEYAMIRDMAKLKDPSEPGYPVHGDVPPHIDARQELIKTQPGWWRKLHIIPTGFDVVSMMRRVGFNIHVLTKGPSSKSQAWAEKVEWVREHMPYADITITEDKGLVYGRVLFDDYPDYVNRWLAWRPRGLVIMLHTQQNASFEHPNIVKIDPATFHEDQESQINLLNRLQVAYERE